METLDLHMTGRFVEARYHQHPMSLGLFSGVIRQVEASFVSRSRGQPRRRQYTSSTEIPQRIFQNDMSITPAVSKAVDGYPVRPISLPWFWGGLDLVMSETAKLET